MKLSGQVPPLACLFASGFLFCGCASVDPHAPVSTLTDVTQRQFQRASINAATAPQNTFTLRWECPGEQYDGFLTTGVESTTNLLTWKREVAFPLTSYSNVWIDPYPDPAKKFYRAFKE